VVLQTRVRAVTRFRVLVVVVDRVCLFELFGELCLFEHFIARTRVILQHYYNIITSYYNNVVTSLLRYITTTLLRHYYVILRQHYYVIVCNKQIDRTESELNKK